MGKTKCKIIKDNPVPSININKFKLFLETKGYHKDGPIITNIVNLINEFVCLNGVETDKEYPDW